MLGLFNPEAVTRPSLAQQLREEMGREEVARFAGIGYTKQVNRANRVKIIGGIPYQAAGGGRRRLSTRADY